MFRRCLALIVIAPLLLAACAGREDHPPSVLPSPSEGPEDLPTRPADYYTGNRACAGIGFGAIRIVIAGGQLPVGESMPPSPAGPERLIWPAGYALIDGPAGPEVHGPGGVRIQNGAILQDGGGCVGEGRTLHIVDVGRVVPP